VDFLPELALGVLPEDEAAEIRRVLDDCADCRAELETLKAAVDLLPAAVDLNEPSALVKEAVLRRVSTEAAPAARPAPLPVQPRVLRPAWRWAGAAAAAIALGIVGGVAGYALRDSGGTGARETAVLEAAGRGDLLVARFNDGTMETALVHAPGERDAFIWVDNLPALPEGKAYQAWFTRDFEEFEPSAVFESPHGGRWVEAGSEVDGYIAMGLTIEDASGAEVPSDAPFVVVELEKSARTRDVPGFMGLSASP
jgi:hypothetical protein